MDPLDGGPHGGLVGQRLAHAHEHDVAHAAVRRRLARARRQHDLLDDLAGREVAVNPAWPVAQNPQPIAHPAWLDTHTVARSG